jgi:uncharacterized protein YegP (UPF0339 family)
MSKYEIYKAADGWRWRLVARNGKIVASGEAYKRKAGVLRGIESHRKTAFTWRVDEVEE